MDRERIFRTNVKVLKCVVVLDCLMVLVDLAAFVMLDSKTFLWLALGTLGVALAGTAAQRWNERLLLAERARHVV